MITTGSSTSIGLETTRRRIARWRERCPYRGAAMPAALWAAAVALARQHGLAGAARVPAPAFVELPPAGGPNGLGPCVIELHGQRGRQLRIEVTGVTGADLVALAQVAWGRDR